MNGKTNKLIVPLLTALVSLALGSGDADAEWPTVRHDPRRRAVVKTNAEITKPTPLWRYYLGGAVSAAALGPSCDRERGINVILVTIDTLRDDHCSVSGYERDTTPGLVELAGQGTRVELAYAPTATYDARLALGYTMNNMHMGAWLVDPRARALVDATYADL